MTESIDPSALARLTAGDGPGLLLDFDGTLAPYAARPWEARLVPAAGRALERLARRGRVAIVSGRTLESLAPLVPPGLWLLGSHGGELCAPGGAREVLVDATAVRPAVAVFLEAARRVAARHDLLVEDKGVAVAVHLRTLTRERAVAVVAELGRAVEAVAPAVVPLHGRDTFEVRAPTATKAHGARALLERWGAVASLVAAGDDVTDEDLFAEVLGRGGVAVKVGEGPSVAPHRLEGPAEVALWLEALAERAG